ncbi:MAG: hypothetical protein ABSG92_06660 [Conexivisphaerales archaeon]
MTWVPYRRRRSKRMLLALAAAVIVVIVVAGLLILPYLAPKNSFTPDIQVSLTYSLSNGTTTVMVNVTNNFGKPIQYVEVISRGFDVATMEWQPPFNSTSPLQVNQTAEGVGVASFAEPGAQYEASVGVHFSATDYYSYSIELTAVQVP